MLRARKLISLILLVVAGCRSHTTAGPRIDFLDFAGALLPSADSVAKLYATPATLARMVLPPMPPPAKMRRSAVDVLLSVDENGRVTHISMTPPRDSAYAREWAKMLRDMRLNPALTRDGVPTKGYAKLHYEF